MALTTHILPDVLRPGLKVVFCGTAAGTTSACRGVYYAGSGNSFWKTLHEAGFTPVRLQAVDFGQLPQFGLGLTDIAKARFGSDHTLSAADFDVQGFREKIKRFAPATIAFNGKAAAAVFLGRRSVELGFGLQKGSGPSVWILPSTSGAARGCWDFKHWRDCALSVLK